VDVRRWPSAVSGDPLRHRRAELGYSAQHRAGDFGLGFLARRVQALKLLLMSPLQRNYEHAVLIAPCSGDGSLVRVGYIRTKEGDKDAAAAQRQALGEAGCEQVVEDLASVGQCG